MARKKPDLTRDQLAAIHAEGAEPGAGRKKRRVSLLKARKQAEAAEPAAVEAAVEAAAEAQVAEEQAEAADQAQAEAEADVGEEPMQADGSDDEDDAKSDTSGDEDEGDVEQPSEAELEREAQRIEQVRGVMGGFVPKPGELVGATPEQVERIDEKMKVALLGSKVKGSPDWTYNLDEGGVMVDSKNLMALFDPRAPKLTAEQRDALSHNGLHLAALPEDYQKHLKEPVVMDLGAYLAALDPARSATAIPLGDSLLPAKQLHQIAAAYPGPVVVRTGRDHPALITKGDRAVLVAARFLGEGKDRVDPVKAFVQDMATKPGPFNELNSKGAAVHVEEGQRKKLRRERQQAKEEQERQERQRQWAAEMRERKEAEEARRATAEAAKKAEKQAERQRERQEKAEQKAVERRAKREERAAGLAEKAEAAAEEAGEAEA